ncbi:MAG: hypothetical protein KUG79_14120 [Pseudomonadales bacterium]|nr:hypothetical protein [Pseudomonadales bacterium]
MVETIENKGSILGGAVWMFIISLLLFWLPLLGPLIAGFVGGRKSGSVGKAILAVLLPGLILGVVIFYCAALLTGIPYIGGIAAAGSIFLVLLGIGPLLCGGIIGGALA